MNLFYQDSLFFLRNFFTKVGDMSSSSSSNPALQNHPSPNARPSSVSSVDYSTSPGAMSSGFLSSSPGGGGGFTIQTQDYNEKVFVSSNSNFRHCDGKNYCDFIVLVFILNLFLIFQFYSSSPSSVSAPSMNQQQQQQRPLSNTSDNAPIRHTPSTENLNQQQQPSGESSSTPPPPSLFIKSFLFSPEVPIRLDYHGKYASMEKVGTITNISTEFIKRT